MPQTGPPHSRAEAPRRPRSGVFHRHRKKTLFVLVVACVFACDVLGTTVLRVLGLYTPVTQSEAAYRRWDPVYHHGLRPGMDCEDGGVWGHLKYTVHTNSLGFKDASTRVVPAAATTKRVLLIGDSFTEGVGFPHEQTFAGILAESLGKKGIEVLNAGCSTYSPVIYRRRVQDLIERQGLVFDHLVVLLDMSDIVDEIKYYKLDEAGNVVRRVENFNEHGKKFIADNTILMNLLRNWLRELRQRGKTGDRHVVDHERSSWTRDPSLWEKYGKPGLAAADLHLDALWQTVRQRGIAMTLVVYPWPDQILNAERDCIQVTYWRDWTQQRGVKFINAFPDFLDAGPAAEVVTRFFIPQDMHWNELGHALMAKTLLAQLQP